MAKDVASPLMSMERVEAVLDEGLAAAGALGGSIAGPAGARGGARGGRLGARLTRLDGEIRSVTVARTPEALQRLADHLGDRLATLQTDGDSWAAVTVVGVGIGGLNPVVVQLVWAPDRLDLTAHAREGWIKQHACRKALDEISSVVRA